jgi:hypothetical protein
MKRCSSICGTGKTITCNRFKKCAPSRIAIDRIARFTIYRRRNSSSSPTIRWKTSRLRTTAVTQSDPTIVNIERCPTTIRVSLTTTSSTPRRLAQTTLNQTARQRFAVAKREVRDLLRRQRLVLLLRRRRLDGKPDQKHLGQLLQRRERHAFDTGLLRHRRLDQRRRRRPDLRSLRHLASFTRRQPRKEPH